MLAHYMNDEDYINEVVNGDIHTTNQKLQDLNLEIQQRLSSMHLYTEQEMKNWDVVGGNREQGKQLKNCFSPT